MVPGGALLIVMSLFSKEVLVQGFEFPQQWKQRNYGDSSLYTLHRLQPSLKTYQCVECIDYNPTNIIIKRLRHADGVSTSLQARFLHRLYHLGDRNRFVPVVGQPLIGRLKGTINRQWKPNKNEVHALLPGFKRVPEMTAENNDLNLNLNVNPRRMMTSETHNSANKLESEEKVRSVSDKSRNGENDTLQEVVTTTENSLKNITNLQRFSRSLDRFERNFYNNDVEEITAYVLLIATDGGSVFRSSQATFTKLVQICPDDRKENGVSFVQSALFVNLALMALSLEVDADTKRVIDECIDFFSTDADKANIIQEVVSSLPEASDAFKFRWAVRLVQGTGEVLRGPAGAAAALKLKVEQLNGTDAAGALTKALNRLIEEDSGGAMHSTFEEDELAGGLRAALLSVVYVRARWRAAPTLLNGSRNFFDADAPPRTTRMLRINDLMRYADLADWDAEALQISYAVPGLSLVLLVPRGRSLRSLAERVAGVPFTDITARMREQRVAVTLPLYTLRMTLLLPSKLEALGIARLMEANCTDKAAGLRLSHAVQRLMFWAEAGRNAFKDDGIEWDEAPELEMVVDRPYVFFVRWHNLNLMSGNFAL